MKSRFLLAAAALAVLAQPVFTAPLAAQTAAIGTWGVDTSGGDAAARPGDDFFAYSAGKWFDATQIPSDRPSVGAFADLRERTSEQLKAMIAGAPAGSKYGALYASMMDEARVEKLGIAPLRRDLAALTAIKSKSAVRALHGRDQWQVRNVAGRFRDHP